MGGFRFVRRDRVILGTLVARHVRGVPRRAAALFPIFARDILKTGPWGLGCCARRRRSAR